MPKKHFYADDTIIYTLAPSVTQAVQELQNWKLSA